MAYNRKAVKHTTKKGMGGHIRPMDWNYYPRDNPNISEYHKEQIEQGLARWEEGRNKAIDAQVEKWQLNPPKSPEGYPRPTSKKKRSSNTNVSTGSSSLKINRPNRLWDTPLNI